MMRRRFLLGLIAGVLHCGGLLSADHPSSLIGDYSVSGPVWPVSESYAFGHRVGGPILVRGVVSPDSSISVLLGGYLDSTTTWYIRASDTDSGDYRWHFPRLYGSGRTGSAEAGVFSPDGAILYAAGSTDGRAKLIALRSDDGSVAWRNADQPGRFYDLTLSPDGLRVYAVGDQREANDLLAVARDSETGEEIWTIRRGEGSAAFRRSYLSVDPRGSSLFILAWSGDQPILLALDAITGDELWEIPLPVTSGRIAACPQSGTIFITGMREEEAGREAVMIGAFDPDSGAVLWERSEEEESVAGGGITGLEVSPDGNTVHVAATLRPDEGALASWLAAFAGGNGEKLWQTREGQTSGSYWRPLNRLALHPADGTVVSADYAYERPVSIHGRHPANGAELWRVDRVPGSSVLDVHATPNGVSVLLGLISVPEALVSAQVTFFLGTEVPGTGEHAAAGPVENVWALLREPETSSAERATASVLSGDGATLFLGGSSRSHSGTTLPLVVAINTATGKERWSYVGEIEGSAVDVQLAADGNTVLVGAAPGGRIAALSAEDGSIVWTHEEDSGGDGDPSHRLAVIDSERIAALFPAEDGASRLAFLDARNGELLQTIAASPGEGFTFINQFAFARASLYAAGKGRPESDAPASFLVIFYRSDTGHVSRRIERSTLEGDAEATEVILSPVPFLAGVLSSEIGMEQIILRYGTHWGFPDWILRLPREVRGEHAVAASGRHLFAMGLNSHSAADPLAPQWIGVEAFDSSDGRSRWSHRIETERLLLRPQALGVAPDGETLVAGYTRTELSTEVVLEGLGARTGEKMWSASYLPPLRGASRIVDLHFGPEPGTLYLVGEGRAGTGGPRMMALAYRFDERAWGDSFEAWRDRNLTGGLWTDRQPHGDPGGHGIPTLIRYALNLDPWNPDRAALPRPRSVTISIDGRAETYLALQFLRRPEVVDLDYIVESSSDLTDWMQVPETNIILREKNPDGTETITVADWVRMDEAETSRRFIRLRVRMVE